MSRLLSTAVTLALACSTVPALKAQSVAGEPSRTTQQTAPTWRSAAFPEYQAARIDYREMPVARLLDLQKRNALRQRKGVQIGMARKLATEGATTAASPVLQWRTVSGGAVARARISSPDALAVRVGLQVKQLHPDVELRFAGSDAPGDVVEVITAGRAQSLADAQGIYWSPSTDGQTQWIEIYRPAHVVASRARLSAPQIAHLIANSRNDFKIVEKIGESGSCNVDAVCRVAELGERYSRALRSVAHMQFVTQDSSGQSGVYICTGTLLNDTNQATQTPYFYSAHHCISTQAEASTLNTFWGYEATTCGGGVAAATRRLSGGATYLYSDANTDALLLRLNDAAPAGVEFSGWDSAAIPASSAVLAIHHPRGDVKKVSSGQHIPAASDAWENGVGWSSGTTEGGSSGSALFTLASDGYRLRGGLHGGNASCANSGNLSNTQNRDYYSRFDVVFPSISKWLAPTGPHLANGSQPLVPGQVPAAVRSAAPAMATPAAAPVTRSAKRTPIRTRGWIRQVEL